MRHPRQVLSPRGPARAGLGLRFRTRAPTRWLSMSAICAASSKRVASRAASTPCAASATSCATRDLPHPGRHGHCRRRRGGRPGRLEWRLSGRPQQPAQRGRQLPPGGRQQDRAARADLRHHHRHPGPGGRRRRRPGLGQRQRTPHHGPGPAGGGRSGPGLLRHRHHWRQPGARVGRTPLRRHRGPGRHADRAGRGWRPADRHPVQRRPRAAQVGLRARTRWPSSGSSWPSFWAGW